MQGGPIVLFNFTQRGENDMLVLSPFSRFMTTSLAENDHTLEYGVLGSITSIPANYNHSMIVFYSSRGINKGMREWGQTMRKAYNRTMEHRLNDLTINYFGYYTDNGGYYYYNTEKRLNYDETIVNLIRGGIIKVLEMMFQNIQLCQMYFPMIFKHYIVDWKTFPWLHIIDIGPMIQFIETIIHLLLMKRTKKHYL